MENLKTVMLPNPKDRRKFKCVVYTKKGTVFAKKVYMAYGVEGARMQLDEWLEFQTPRDYDRKSIEIVPMKPSRRTS